MSRKMIRREIVHQELIYIRISHHGRSSPGIAMPLDHHGQDENDQASNEEAEKYDGAEDFRISNVCCSISQGSGGAKEPVRISALPYHLECPEFGDAMTRLLLLFCSLPKDAVPILARHHQRLHRSPYLLISHENRASCQP